MNSLDKLIRQSNLLIEIINELITSIQKAKAKNEVSQTEMSFLNDTIKKTLVVSKSFMENYNEFITNQIEIVEIE